MTDKIALAELYHSVKGEGLYTGTPMTFVRLAGCSVGKPMRDDFAAQEPRLAEIFSGEQLANQLPILKFNHPAWMCAAYDGRQFWCDTDFNKMTEATIEEIFDFVYEPRICLTGGEPLMHEEIVQEIIEEAFHRNIHVHIETSGKHFVEKRQGMWIACSPKIGYLSTMLNQADEIKLLVDEGFNINDVPPEVMEHELVWLQPINNEMGIRSENMIRCLELLKEFPKWRLSPQMHKLIGVR